jgi:hypothetical protein
MTNPLKILNKQLSKNKIYPSEVARVYAKKGYSPSKIALELNTYFKKEVLTSEEINNILLEVKKQHKLVENSEVSLSQKKYYATTSIVSSVITENIAKENENSQAIWLASGSSNPSFSHLENYNKVFNLDEGIDGELPAERPNCQCGFSIIKGEK